MTLNANEARKIADEFHSELSSDILEATNIAIECLYKKIKEFASLGKYELYLSRDSLASLGIVMPNNIENLIIKNIVKVLKEESGYTITLNKETFFTAYIIKWK